MNEPAMTFRDQAILEHLCHEHWGLQESVMDRLLEIVARHADGVKLPAKEIAEAIGSRPARNPEDEYRIEGETAVIGVSGVLAKHANLVNGVSQPPGSSVGRIRADLDRAMADARVRNVLLRIESPGGMIAGISDLGEAIYQARSIKRVVAFADDLAASAAYWLASQAAEVYANQTAAVGSIGVVAVLTDESGPAGRDGTRFHVVRAGERKSVGGGPLPVGEGDLAEAQGRVDALHEVFMAQVARGRGVGIEAVRPVADGRILTGQQAVDAGLVDGIATLDAVMAMLDTQDTFIGGPGGPAAATVSTVAAGDRESEMTNENTSPQKMPAADPLGAGAEAIRAAAVKDANAAAAQRVRDLTAALGPRTELLTRAIAEGLDVPAAKAQLADVLAAEVKALTEQLAGEQAKTQAAQAELAQFKELAARSGIKPLAIGAKSEQADAGGAAAFDQAVEARRAELLAKGAEENKARAQAYRDVAGQHPDWHEAWKAGQARQ